MDLRRVTILPEPLKKGVLDLIDPVADRLIEAGLTPNRITTISVLILVVSGAAFGFGHLHLGGGLLLASGFFDILDGKVARRGHMSSTFGAFYDSSMDRFGEGILFAGIAIYYMTSAIFSYGNREPVLALGLCFACLIGSYMVSYTRARAEGVGLEAKVGMAQRAERIVFLGGATLFFGAGSHGWMLLGILAGLSLVSWITMVQRIWHVYNITRDEVAVKPAPNAPVSAPRAGAAPADAPLTLSETAAKGS